MPIDKPLILFIDAYDSFSNNIISLFETTLDCSARRVKIDNPILLSSDSALYEELSHYAAVVCGPGPGHPGKEEDVGIMSRIWRLGEKEMLPVLGICLGFQSLCLEFGAEVKTLRGPQHGMIRRVTHVGETNEGKESIFEAVGEVKATLYQSLCVDLGQDLESTNIWQPMIKCPDLVPLAWVTSDDADMDAGVLDDRILVGVRHRTKPFWALQYHPESICTNEESKKVIQNWFEAAKTWNRSSRQNPICIAGLIVGGAVVRESLLDKSKLPQLQSNTARSDKLQPFIEDFGLESIYRSRTIKLPEYVSVPDILETIQNLRQDQIVLESSNAHGTSLGSADVRGRYSIIGLDIDETLRFEYKAGSNSVDAMYSGKTYQVDLRSFGGVWKFLGRFLDMRKIKNENVDSPFWGGFMGYTTYELGLEGISVESRARKETAHSRPDLSFAWITRSLVIDHLKKLIYLQDLSLERDPRWMDKVANKIDELALPKAHMFAPLFSSSHPLMSPTSASSSTTSLSTNLSANSQAISSRNSIYSHDSPKSQNDDLTIITPPSYTSYEKKVDLCQAFIKCGDSYELCLTDQTTVQRPRSDHFETWHLYRTLRARQPAPFASYLRLGTATFISASPERFLAYSRTGKCSLRPMKGTVRKTPTVSTLAAATALLDIPKEKAENLMIVDLVRHDLHSICGAGNVQVPRLMVVEEYKSVFQMISVVEGQIPQGKGYSGLDVLVASLPPGSMTGAPKKRSCEILQEIEGKERGLYSGVVGYMDVGGRGDWSVNIRCMFRWDDEDVISSEGEKRIETWHIGAGGAVTALSTPVGEREEMLTKLNGTLGVFKWFLFGG